VSIKNNFLRHTVTLRPAFEVISETGAYNFGEQVEWRRFAWQAPEAQGSDLSGNLYIHVTREVRSEQHGHPIRQAPMTTSREKFALSPARPAVTPYHFRSFGISFYS
jgi:hypothetical protein